MESIKLKHQNYPTNWSKFSNSHSLQLVILFFVILLSSSLFPLMFQLMQFLNCKMGKNYMFLLCNGILVIIVKNSGLISNSQPQESNQITGKSREKIGGSPMKSQELSEVKTVVTEEKNVGMEVEEAREIEHKSSIVVRNVHLIAKDKADDQQWIENGIATVEEEEEEEEEVGLLSAEELNKKCDDFIRKMKEGIRFEAQ
ncbi:hypothetical protein P3X46_018079 [Hevea brasiliensis]|uniref:DUF4408 domain-containing protein n=1 Tax=Hevea brasiliensis TaxID=3981 RepID=A0ABQ9LPM5_HEVBR|nr:uncharacterized protein LOC110644681 [Hevea brasiliensis]KAJ9169937.1 hypothetical protein P3X46_018079 [Hevea brasiliensis]